MVSLTFWQQLTPAQQKMMTDIWTQNAPAYRANMAAAQTTARKTLESHGIKFTDPKPAEIEADRGKMMMEQDALAKELNISPDMAKLVTSEASATG